MQFYKWVTLFFFFNLCAYYTNAQDNYEIQVYGSQTIPKNNTMLELHSNFTFHGSTTLENGVTPTNHMLHETTEITHGWNNWFETGFYIFTALNNNGTYHFVGAHIRPRAMVPTSWNWPVGVSLSLEGGFQSRAYSEDDQTIEIRPIIDKQMGKFYWGFNPTFEKSFHGLNQNAGYIFSPNVKASYSINKIVATGIEYYGSVGPFSHFSPMQQQQHQLFAAVDLDLTEDWEFNCGYGVGFTKSTDNAIFKIILGYRLHR